MNTVLQEDVRVAGQLKNVVTIFSLDCYLHWKNKFLLLLVEIIQRKYPVSIVHPHA